MDNNFDTIVAIATPMASSAIGIIRISGSSSFEIAKKIFKGKIENRRICYGHIVDGYDVLDEVILLPFLAPKSYTGEDVIEIQSHGSYVILNNIMNLIIANGARVASRGEFTKRAYLNHRIDLSQAEAVLDLINSRSTKSVSGAICNLEGYLKNKINSVKSDLTKLYSKIIASIDFPEDVAELNLNTIVSICNDKITEISNILDNSKSHNFIRDGVNICLIGKPNAGKSSLFNALLNYSRSIVTSIEGTTRDTISESLNINGYLLNFIDTAGIRDKNSADIVEKIGIEQSIESIKTSNIILFLFENSLDEIDTSLIELAKGKSVIFVKTKCDLYNNDNISANNDIKIVVTSSVTGFGIDDLKNAIFECVKDIIPGDTAYTTNIRQQTCLTQAKSSLENVISTAKLNPDTDLYAYDLKSAILALGEITGEVLTDSILDNIFNEFCIGK